MAKPTDSLEDGGNSSLEPLLSSHRGMDGKDEAGSSPVRKRRWTWKHTVALGIGGIATALVVLAFCIRPLAVRAIDATKMDIQRMQLQYPRNDTVQLTTQLAITSDSPFGVTMHPAELTIQYEEATVGVFNTPAMDISHGTSVHTIENATLTVTNFEAWTQFAAAMVHSTNMTWTLSGQINISLHLLSIPISNLPLTKAMVLRGMDGLRSLVVSKMDLTMSTATQVLAAIDTCLFNPSATALVPVGSLCFNVFYPHPTTLLPTHVGRLTSVDSSLPVARTDPSDAKCTAYGATGMNSMALHGHIESSDPAATSALISQYLSGNPAHVQVTGCWPNASSVSLYNGALRSLRLNSTLPPNPIPLIQSLAFTSMQLVPGSDTAVEVHTTVVATTQSPLGDQSPLMLSSMTMALELASEDDERLGTLSTHQVDVYGNVTGTSNVTLTCAATLNLNDAGTPFGRFVHSLVEKRQMPMWVRGSFDVIARGALGALTLKSVPVRVLSSVGGMAGLSNVSIVDFALPGPHSSEGQLVTAISDIWNPSVIAMDVGEVRLRLSVTNESVLGRVAAHIALQPESATRVHLKGHLKPDVDAHGDLRPDVSAFFSRYISNEPSRLEIAIASVNTTVPWLQQGLAHVQTHSTFPGVAVDLISRLTMASMHIRFDAVSMHMHATMQAQVEMPPALAHFPINITHLQLTSQLASDRVVLTRVAIPLQAVQYTPTAGGTGSVAFESAIALHSTDVPAMAEFVRRLMFASGDVPLTIQSSQGSTSGAHVQQKDKNAMERLDGVSPVVQTPMGRMNLTNLPVSASFALSGMDGFLLGGVNITSVDIVSGTSDTLVLSMALTMTNPSQVTAVLDVLAVQVWLGGSLLGTAAMANVTLACCNATSALTGLFSFRPTNATAGRAFLSHFVSGTDGQEVRIQGTKDSSPNPYLQVALPQLRLQSSVPSLAQFFPAMPTLVSLSKMYKPSIWDLFTVATALKVRNPFGHAINVTATNLRLYPCAAQHKESSGQLVCTKYYDVPLARFNPKEFEPMVIPATTTPDGCFTCCQGSKCADAMPLCPGATAGACMKAKVDMSLWSLEMIKTLYATMTTGLLMHVEGTLTAMIDEYPMDLDYVQDGLLVEMA